MPGLTPGQAEGAALIGRMAGGDRRAFADFYDRYGALAFTLIRRVLPAEADAEDVLQDVFWGLWQEAARYDEHRGSPEAWILNRARSRAIDRLRSIRRRSETFVAPAVEPPAAADGATGNPAAAAEDRHTVQGALAVLSDPQRQVIEMAYYAGFTQSEIADRLGEPLGTVKSRLRAALERLRAHFRAAEGALS
jgi:RNA polymerase sigma-70 factor (ECF subfamily)